ncbi:hypothetical protein GCM10010531_38830 [Blastococcus jejuensis]|uniref:Uncharacterized protein n=1 Tax=Blastococcus jejuensis TaxID=351224 RepID=A0ABP6PJW8_9ACTN
MTWVLVIGAGWLLLAALIAVLIGRSVRLADARAAAEAERDEPNFAVDPATEPGGSPAGTVLPFPATAGDAPPTPAPRPSTGDAPTIPGIPVARPGAPRAQESGSQTDPIRRTGIG